MLLTTGLAIVSQIANPCQIPCCIIKFCYNWALVQEVEVQGVQAHLQKFWFGENLGKIRGNLGKISENLHKIPENLSNTLKIWAKMAPKIAWRAFFGGHFFFLIFFRARLREYGQKFFAPTKICLLLHRCSWMNKGDVTRLRHKYKWYVETLVTSSITPCLKILWGLPPRLGPRPPPSKSGADSLHPASRAPKRGALPRGGTFRGPALLVKRKNSKWSFTNEPEVRFRFWMLVKVGPTIRHGLAGTVLV